MTENLSKYVRKNLNSKENLKKIELNLNEKLKNKFNLGFIVCSGNKTLYKNYNQSENEIIICFLSDILDIDSKFMTFIKKDLKEINSIFDLLYKFDCNV
jgi:hypothetical protein